MSVAQTRTVFFLLTLVFVIVVGFLASFFLRGYRLDPKTLSLKPSGLFVATSVPDGAQIVINGELESATNDTISLPPDTYDVEIRKDGFLGWKKRLTIKAEEVVKIEALLFPSAPSLSAITTTGVINPVLSPDGTKIAYGVSASSPYGVLSSSESEQRTGIWVMELADLPVGFSREPRQITDAPLGTASWRFSPDSRQILLTAPNGSFLLPISSLTTQNRLVNIQGEKLKKLALEWSEEEKKKLEERIDKLPREIQDVLRRKAKKVVFSPDDKKVLYTTSSPAQVPENLIPPLPGSSTQKQDRNIKANQTYVYDIKEDRNFLVYDKEALLESNPFEEGKTTLTWFPTSNHLILAETNKITIMDYDGTNQQVVFGGQYESPYAIPYPNSTQLLILTSLGAGDAQASNLYSLRLR